MINITPISRNEFSDLQEILNKKHISDIDNYCFYRFLSLRYETYQELENGKRISPLKLHDYYKDNFIKLYSSLTKKAKCIINLIINNNICNFNLCLSCGIYEAVCLDHFLPKSDFPEYSILHKNLIPICLGCNSKKSNHIPGFKNNYFHPYFDILPKECLFVISFIYTDDIPIATYSVKDKFNSSIFNSHVKSLDLLNRLSKKSNQILLQYKFMKNNYGLDLTLQTLQSDILKSESNFGSFFWEYNFYSEVLRNKVIENI